jgi:hypothetical protein
MLTNVPGVTAYLWRGKGVIWVPLVFASDAAG